MVAQKKAPAKKAAAKKAPAKKAAAAKKAAPAKETTPRSLGANDPDFQTSVVELRDEQEMKWSEIATELECTPGKAMLAYAIVNMPAKDKIKAKDEDELAAAIVEARDTLKESWGRISARAGLAESKVRKIYEDTTGDSTRGNRIGKGGRYVAGAERPEKVPAAKKAGAAKKAPAKKAAAAKKAAPKKTTGSLAIKNMDVDELTERLTGKTITVDGKRIKVKSVSSLDEDGTMNFADEKGANRAVLVGDITAATK